MLFNTYLNFLKNTTAMLYCLLPNKNHFMMLVGFLIGSLAFRSALTNDRSFVGTRAAGSVRYAKHWRGHDELRWMMMLTGPSEKKSTPMPVLWFC